MKLLASFVTQSRRRKTDFPCWFLFGLIKELSSIEFAKLMIKEQCYARIKSTLNRKVFPSSKISTIIFHQHSSRAIWDTHSHSDACRKKLRSRNAFIKYRESFVIFSICAPGGIKLGHRWWLDMHALFGGSVLFNRKTNRFTLRSNFYDFGDTNAARLFA